MNKNQKIAIAAAGAVVAGIGTWLVYRRRARRAINEAAPTHQDSLKKIRNVMHKTKETYAHNG